MPKVKINWEKVLLALILLMAGFIYFFEVGKEGYGNTYYAAAVKSMLQSFHNFFFVSFDPAGYVSVDKPALGLWLQTLFVWLFGFKGWSLILPQALASVISVTVLFKLVKKVYGSTAGLIAALVLATTPIFAAVSRTNNLDATLVLVVLLAAGTLMAATGQGSFKLLAISMFLVGLGFNVKMLEAFMVLPAFYLVYLLFAPIQMAKKIGQLAAATGILLVISIAWALVVDLTPADKRPYVGSSNTNSVIELALGYNGIQRIMPFRRGFRNSQEFNLRNTTMRKIDRTGASPEELIIPASRPETTSAQDIRRTGGEGGSPGVLRIFNRQLAGQISWLLPLVLIGLVAAVTNLKRTGVDIKTKLITLVLWGIWMASMLVYFSISGFFHRYYMAMLAPSVAALAGIGILTMYHEYQEESWQSWLLPLSILIAILWQVIMLSRYPGWSKWLIPGVLTPGVASVAILTLMKMKNKIHEWKATGIVTSIGIFALLIAPVSWAATPIIYHSEVQMPYAGPELGQRTNTFFRPRTNAMDMRDLINYLRTHQGNEKYLVVVPNASIASNIILNTSKPVISVIPLGGFSGRDRILTVNKFAAMVEKNEIKYFLIMNPPEVTGMRRFRNLAGFSTSLARAQNNNRLGIMFGGMNRSQNDIVAWVEKHGALVPNDQWNIKNQFTSEPDYQRRRDNLERNYRLYDLSRPEL